ncbi:hypothetical protein [Okeania sp. SIO1I7]|nr:hypothetical protein [Okeania sp. SIO1I7]
MIEISQFSHETQLPLNINFQLLFSSVLIITPESERKKKEEEIE